VCEREREREREKCYTGSRRRGISYVQYKRGRLLALVTSCVRTNCLLKHIIEGKMGEEYK
jgi:hypothetical protein